MVQIRPKMKQAPSNHENCPERSPPCATRVGRSLAAMGIVRNLSCQTAVKLLSQSAARSAGMPVAVLATDFVKRHARAQAERAEPHSTTRGAGGFRPASPVCGGPPDLITPKQKRRGRHLNPSATGRKKLVPIGLPRLFSRELDGRCC